MRKWTRRAFIGFGTLVGGGFVLGVAGVALSPSRHSVLGDDAADAEQLTTWILITPDNIVTVLVPHCEMGQGSQTALAMMAAEELNADWNLVRVKEAPALGAYANAYMGRAFTGDSIPGPLGRGIRLRNLSPRPLVRAAADGGLVGRSWHGSLRDDRGRCRGAGDARRRRRREVRRARFRVQGRQLTHRARRIWKERSVWRAGRRRSEALGALAAGAERPGELHHPPHGTAAVRHPTEGRRQRGLRHRFQHARHVVGGRRNGAGGRRQALVGRRRSRRSDAGRETRRAARERRRGRRRHLLARAHGHRRARPQVRRCRPRRCVDGVDFRGLRHRARRATGAARRGGQTRHRRLPCPVPGPRDDGADGVHGRASKAIAPTCGLASRIRSTHGPPRRRRSVSTPNRCV